MELLQYIHDNDTVFTLVTKKLTKNKMHELLDKLQEFVSSLQEKDLSDDVMKDMTIKKNFQKAGSQVYLNYGFQPPSLAQPAKEPQALTTKRFFPELAESKSLDLLDDSIIPNKKIKPNRSPELSVHNSSTIHERKESLTQSHTSTHNINSFLKCIEKGYKPFSSIQKTHPSQESHEMQKHNYVPPCQPDLTIFSPLYKDPLEYSNTNPFTDQQNAIEIDKDEFINKGRDSLNLLNNKTSERCDDSKAHQKRSEFTVNFAEYKFSANFEERRTSSKIHKTSPEFRERRKEYERSSYKKHEHSKYRNYNKSAYSKSLVIKYPSDKKSYRHYDKHEKYSQRSQERHEEFDDNAEAPIFLIDAKENERIYKHLRKPFHYFKPARETEDESNSPNYIQVD